MYALDKRNKESQLSIFIYFEAKAARISNQNIYKYDIHYIHEWLKGQLSYKIERRSKFLLFILGVYKDKYF